MRDIEKILEEGRSETTVTLKQAEELRPLWQIKKTSLC